MRPQGAGDVTSRRIDLRVLDGYAGLSRLFERLPQARLVGGSVRDLLCGEVPGDLDLATPEPPETVSSILEAAGIKVVPTGLSHGTVTAVIDGHAFEITTLRRDDRTDGRHAEVSWTSDWREDAARRDFTINALSCDPAGVVWDYFAGVADLEARLVRFVGDPGRRIEEDALRILRFFRFTARFGAVPDRAAMEAIAARAALVDGLSRERVASEMLRLLAGPRVVAMLEAMRASGVLDRVVLGEAVPLARLERLMVAGAPPDPILRLAALAPDAEATGRAWRLSKAQIARLAASSGALPEPVSPVLLPGVGDDAIAAARSLSSAQTLIDRAWLRQACETGDSAAWNDLRARIAAMKQPVFPLGGRDALAAGMAPGAAMGAALNATQAWWRAHGCRPDHAACVAHLRASLGGGGAARAPDTA